MSFHLEREAVESGREESTERIMFSKYTHGDNNPRDIEKQPDEIKSLSFVIRSGEFLMYIFLLLFETTTGKIRIPAESKSNDFRDLFFICTFFLFC